MHEADRYNARDRYHPRGGERNPERYGDLKLSSVNSGSFADRHEDSLKYSKTPSQYDTSVSPTEMDYQYEPQPRQDLYNLKYLCTARAICQMMEFALNLLIVIFAGVSYNSSQVYRDIASLGGLYAYYYGGANAFTGADAAHVKELDAQFYQLKQPIYAYTMAVGGALMGYTGTVLVLGILRVPYRWPGVLLAEALLNGLVALGYVPAVAFYFLKLQEAYSTDTCKERQQLYQSKGHQGFECRLNGGDVCGGLFGAVGTLVFAFGALLAVRAFREVRDRKKRSQQERSFQAFN